ncbi:MAG: GNAT family N-acetyltransferase [Chloroflexota bacterium]
MQNISLRQFKYFDQDAVWQLHIEGLEQTGSFIDNPEYDSDLGRIIADYIENRGDFIVATCDELIVGSGGLRRVNNETAEIKRMRVTPQYQGQGIGELILDYLMKKAQALGYQRLILDTTARQRIAQQLYKSRGFKEYDRGSVGGLEVVFYELSLPKTDGNG